eukprot:TRINITY_DN5720_c0_g1_i1.p1 TRINITY_DN5720_c0_g1~~TRINITY_DN5720_c0_g1_i1.p1  ORF type:complete len:283 (-),score=55.89 TRINITY_DN5720_c0_g1_i1:83-931(-)
MDLSTLERNKALIIAGIAAAGLGVAAFRWYQRRKYNAPISTYPLHSSMWRKFKLVSKKRSTHNTNILRFELPKSTDTLNVPAGMHLEIRIALPDDKESIHAYAPINEADAKGYFEVLVKNHHELDKVAEGEEVNVRGPLGTYRYRPNDFKKVGIICAGANVASLLAIAKAAQSALWDRTEIHAVVADVAERDVLYASELDKIAAKGRVHVWRQLQDAPTGWQQGTGFVTAETIKQQMPAPSRDAVVLIAGPTAMVSSVQKLLVSAGYAPDMVHVLCDQTKHV